MYRRLFFLFPDKQTTQQAVNALVQENISTKQMHTLSKVGVNLDGLPISSPNQQRDMHSIIEKNLWNFNLSIFVTALFVLIGSLIYGYPFIAIIAFITMAASYVAGYYYLTIPTMHLATFHAAFQHHEILLMVDIAKDQVAHIEQIVSHGNPSALEQGISWTPSNLSYNI